MSATLIFSKKVLSLYLLIFDSFRMETVDNKQKQMPGIPPKTWLVESILVTLFCCLPFGIAGIVYATRVETLFYAGQIEAAERASREAGKWTKVSFWVGLGCALLYILFWVISIAIGTAADLFS